MGIVVAGHAARTSAFLGVLFISMMTLNLPISPPQEEGVPTNEEEDPSQAKLQQQDAELFLAASLQGVECDSIPALLHAQHDSSSNDNDQLPLERNQVNQLRRHLALQDPSCFERHLPLFAQHFWAHRTTRHVNLHLPKTGGSSVCALVKKSYPTAQMRTTGSNCWPEQHSFCPQWCCCDPKWSDHNAAPTCQAQRESFADIDFVMNENYFQGFCNLDERMHSILIRPPVDRAISNVDHYLRQLVRKQSNPSRNLNLIQANYMTWSLVALDILAPGRSNELASMDVRPGPEHLPVAHKVLSQMDYIVDLLPDAGECNRAIFELMGVGANVTLARKQAAKNTDYQSVFHSESYRAMNELDLQLYDFAQQLRAVDCDFFQYLVSHPQQAGDAVKE